MSSRFQRALPVVAAIAASGSTATEGHVEGLALFTGRISRAVLEGLRSAR